MKLTFTALLVCMLPGSQAQRKAFLDPQSDCQIECLNGGFCAYLVDDPSTHACLCLLELYHGDRCQYKVVDKTEEASTTQTNDEGVSESKPEEELDLETKGLEEEYAGEWDSYEEEDYSDDGQENGQISDEELNNLIDNQVTKQTDNHRSNEMPNDAQYFETVSESHTDGFDTEQMITETPKADYALSSKASLSRLRPSNPNLIPDGESEYHGWMMSKRRRIVHSSSSNPFSFFSYISTLLFLRYILCSF